jgi:hypothetical protein
MSRHNIYQNETTDLLISKIDSLIQKSKATRSRIANNHNMRQRGGNPMGGPTFVSLDTPVDGVMRGGNPMGEPTFVSLDTPVDGVMRGGNPMGEPTFVSLDTPVDGVMRGGNPMGEPEFIGFDEDIPEFDSLDVGLDQANNALNNFNMIGGGCGCDDFTLNADDEGSCGGNSYNRQRGGASNTEMEMNNLDRALQSIDGLLKGF